MEAGLTMSPGRRLGSSKTMDHFWYCCRSFRRCHL